MQQQQQQQQQQQHCFAGRALAGSLAGASANARRGGLPPFSPDSGASLSFLLPKRCHGCALAALAVPIGPASVLLSSLQRPGQSSWWLPQGVVRRTRVLIWNPSVLFVLTELRISQCIHMYYYRLQVTVSTRNLLGQPRTQLSFNARRKKKHSWVDHGRRVSWRPQSD
jgi:hypothetical protein